MIEQIKEIIKLAKQYDFWIVLVVIIVILSIYLINMMLKSPNDWLTFIDKKKKGKLNNINNAIQSDSIEKYGLAEVLREKEVLEHVRLIYGRILTPRELNTSLDIYYKLNKKFSYDEILNSIYYFDDNSNIRNFSVNFQKWGFILSNFLLIIFFVLIIAFLIYFYITNEIQTTILDIARLFLLLMTALVIFNLSTLRNYISAKTATKISKALNNNAKIKSTQTSTVKTHKKFVYLHNPIHRVPMR